MAEDQAAPGMLPEQDVHQPLETATRGDHVDPMEDILVLLPLLRQGQGQGGVEVAVRQRAHLGGHRRREEPRAAILRQRVQDGLQLLAEPHVQHLVALVQDDAANVPGPQTAALDVVPRPSRGPHDDRRPLPEGPELRRHLEPSDEGHHRDVEVAHQPLRLPRGLLRQLPGRSQHQKMRRALRDAHILQEGQEKGQGFPRTRPGPHDEVPSPPVGFQNPALHGGGGLEPLLLQGTGKLVPQSVSAEPLLGRPGVLPAIDLQLPVLVPLQPFPVPIVLQQITHNVQTFLQNHPDSSAAVHPPLQSIIYNSIISRSTLPQEAIALKKRVICRLKMR